jgi:hypothetical protein
MEREGHSRSDEARGMSSRILRLRRKPQGGFKRIFPGDSIDRTDGASDSPLVEEKIRPFSRLKSEISYV